MLSGLAASYLADEQRLEVVAAYLRHEAGKGLCTAKPKETAARTSKRHDRAVAEALNRLSAGASMQDLLGSASLERRWVLFHGVSCGCYRKELWNCVGEPSFDWCLERRPVKELVFDSCVGPLKGYRDGAPTMSQAVEFLRRLNDDDRDHHKLSDPLIGRAQESSVLIHDGNGRLLSCAYAVRDGTLAIDAEIDVWVGAETRLTTRADKEIRERALCTLFVTPEHRAACSNRPGRDPGW